MQVLRLHLYLSRSHLKLGSFAFWILGSDFLGSVMKSQLKTKYQTLSMKKSWRLKTQEY